MRSHTLNEALDALKLRNGMSVSFHHHLRNGDYVLNMVLRELYVRDVLAMKLYPSAIFPVHTSIMEGLENGNIESITTNYMRGPVSDYLFDHGIDGQVRMQTHGGRARSIIEGENPIDIAFVAASAVDAQGNASGLEGKSACGSLGYAAEDVAHAGMVVLITDTRIETLKHPQIDAGDVDMVVEVEAIGDRAGIVSGTLSITTDPLGLKIARDAMRFLNGTGMIKDGVSFQSGAGGISLAITQAFTQTLKRDNVHASFFTGGITQHHTRALEQGLVDNLYDVQCFDMAAIDSLKRNPNHHFISASDYANPNNDARKIKALDIVILGAAQMDCDFNVNVTTDARGVIMGGSGGHSDTAEDAKLCVVVSPLFKGRMPLITERVTTITTPGAHVDVLITERGIAINPLRTDLIERFKDSTLPLFTIEALMHKARALSGKPKTPRVPSGTLGRVESRHGVTLDVLRWKG